MLDGRCNSSSNSSIECILHYNKFYENLLQSCLHNQLTLYGLKRGKCLPWTVRNPMHSILNNVNHLSHQQLGDHRAAERTSAKMFHGNGPIRTNRR